MPQSNLLPLKVLVISLGVVLIGGTVFLFAAIASKAGKEVSLNHCHDAKITLPKGKLLGISPEGDKVIVTLSASDIEVITIDRCSGKIEQTLTLAP